MPDNRSDRLAFDYREMLKIQNQPYLSWVAAKGGLPCVEEYLLTVKIRTYALSVTSGVTTVGVIDSCTVKVTLWDSYPYVAPHIKMLSTPPVFHPNWYSKGAYCASEPWRPEGSLKDYIKRMIETLQYDPSCIEAATPANYKALEWYQKNSGNPALFPSDKTELTENSPEAAAAAEKAAKAFDEIIDRW